VAAFDEQAKAGATTAKALNPLRIWRRSNPFI
jgi:hypothetical protein